MVFQPEEVQKVRDFLGVPSLSNPQALKVEGRLQRLPPEAAARVRDLLSEIDASRAGITAAMGRLKAAKVGEVTLNPQEVRQRWENDLLMCQQLGQVIDFPPIAHPSMGPGYGAPRKVAVL